MLNIDQDSQRFRDIVKGRVRRELRRFMSSKELIGKQGKELVSIPVHEIGIPKLRYGKNEKQGGIGQGDGQPGDESGQPGKGQKAGDQPADHLLEVEFTVDELAELLGEELELPGIEPKGRQESKSKRARYKGISLKGPESLRHGRRTFKQALKRNIAAGGYNPNRPRIIPIREDRRYRHFEMEDEPRSACVVLYMMDVSGSMGQAQKEIVRSEVFWIDAWLRHHYEGFEARFLIHDAAAREVDRDTFFRTRESGGTLISSAYTLCQQIIERDYPVSEWNIYPFHFSDGDNASSKDNELCTKIVRESLLPVSNQFSYAQVDSPYGSGRFLKVLKEEFSDEEAVVISRVADRDAIMDSIKELLGKGR
ncbi:MAG: DUF444 family protein [Myxococcales bacterium]|nr:DUF444 family protein [Myxococcales bacterium]